MTEEKKLTAPKKTFGQQYLDIQKEETGYAHVSEVRKGLVNQNDWDTNMEEVIIATRKQVPYDKFYIDVRQKREQLANKTIRNYFISRLSCPTPSPGHIVFRVEKGTTHATQLWVLPDLDTCIFLRKNANLIDEKERQLLQWVFDFHEGKLDRLASIENGEPIIQSTIH